MKFGAENGKKDGRKSHERSMEFALVCENPRDTFVKYPDTETKS